MLKKLFQLEDHQTTVKKEWTAGLTSFFTIAYILIINPAILSDTGMPYEFALLATALVTAVGCLLIGLWGNAPIILTPGMGVNAFFAYTLVIGMGWTWQQGLAIVLLSGVLFLITALTPLAGKLAKAVPLSLKQGITVGIGVFLTFIGLQKGGLVQGDEETFVALGNLAEPAAMLTLFGLVIMLMLVVRKVKGAFLIGIAVISLAAGLFGISSGSAGEKVAATGDYASVFTAADFSAWSSIPFWTAVFSLTMIIVFESMGLLHGLLERKEKFGRSYQAAAVTAFGSGFLGTSPTIPAAESAAGVAEGGKTGLTAVVTGLLFLVALLFTPLLGFIPESAIAPVLIIVGGMMVQEIRHISFDDASEWFPAYLVIGIIPLTYSIADGIAFGFIAYPLLKMALGSPRAVSPVMYAISFLFFLHYVFTYMV
ncbi:NCS2 family permease [Marinococcus halotolerans]|uniref:NCS2 family permease n=1 Tax=Marinococcus halotolerans TaxID=301092 RepID=UPI0003F66989|nr:NCS2 family permease [Marinococcus halotolerans]